MIVESHVHKSYNLSMKTITCLQCGEKGIQKTKKERKFCSKKCSQKYHRLLDPERHRAYWKKYYDSKPEWHEKRAREYEEKRGHDWKRAVNNKATRKYKEITRHGGHKEFLLNKFGGCEECNTTESLQVHHIDRVSFHNSNKPNNDLSNLRLLCQTCHLKLHHRQGWSRNEPRD